MRHNFPERNEVHICDASNGHMLSSDCWCEPTQIKQVVNKHGISILVVEHEDNTLEHHLDVVMRRSDHSRYQDLFYSPDSNWITRVLDRIGQLPMLPPGDMT